MQEKPMTKDDILESAARLIEEPSLTDLMGALAKTKKAKIQYDMRMEATLKERERCAGVVRAMMDGKGLDPITQLRRIAEIPPDSPRHELHLVEAWPLAWKGWLTIECRINCGSNHVPPETAYLITLTDEGKAALAAAEKAQPVADVTCDAA
jgi:hypothetical protein